MALLFGPCGLESIIWRRGGVICSRIDQRLLLSLNASLSSAFTYCGGIPLGSKYPIIIYLSKTCTINTTAKSLRTQILGTWTLRDTERSPDCQSHPDMIQGARLFLTIPLSCGPVVGWVGWSLYDMLRMKQNPKP